MTQNLLERHREFFQALDGHTVEAGWFETARYQAGEGVDPKLVGVPVAKIARINEFGATIKQGNRTIIIPARPFMRKAVADFNRQNTSLVMTLTKKVFRGKLEPKQALAQIGMFMEGLIVDSVKNGGWKRNAPFTIAKKGFDAPLIETGQMWQAVTSKVVKTK